jgi:hypothetical protein
MKYGQINEIQVKFENVLLSDYLEDLLELLSETIHSGSKIELLDDEKTFLFGLQMRVEKYEIWGI